MCVCVCVEPRSRENRFLSEDTRQSFTERSRASVFLRHTHTPRGRTGDHGGSGVVFHRPPFTHPHAYAHAHIPRQLSWAVNESPSLTSLSLFSLSSLSPQSGPYRANWSTAVTQWGTSGLNTTNYIPSTTDRLGGKQTDWQKGKEGLRKNPRQTYLKVSTTNHKYTWRPYNKDRCHLFASICPSTTSTPEFLLNFNCVWCIIHFVILDNQLCWE